jgi:hypothetical protein
MRERAREGRSISFYESARLFLCAFLNLLFSLSYCFVFEM